MQGFIRVRDVMTPPYCALNSKPVNLRRAKRIVRSTDKPETSLTIRSLGVSDILIMGNFELICQAMRGHHGDKFIQMRAISSDNGTE
jgi:hypothetical protein